MNKLETLLRRFISKPHFIDKDISLSTKLPKITIVTPSYNQGKYLERTILSVLNQDYPNLEYFIFDGGSSDQSVDIIKKYEKYLTYWESKSDEGQSDAISKGFNLATGDILAWINSDDVYWPGAFWFVGNYFINHPHVDVIYGNSFTIDGNDNILRETRSVKFSRLGFLTFSFSLHQASMFWQRKIYKKSSGINRKLALTMDRDLWFQFFQIGGIFCHVQRTLSCYRDHAYTKTRNEFSNYFKMVSELLFDRFGIDAESHQFRLLRKLMRLRTLLLHIVNGNIDYLFESAGRKVH